MNMDLFQRSLEIIEQNQTRYGSFPACLTFDTYAFSWLRDGSFIAHALDKTGRFSRAERFYRWAQDAVLRKEQKLDRLFRKLEQGEKLEKSDFLNARLTLKGGDEEEQGWGNFQLDGYGIYLWALARHFRITGEPGLSEHYGECIGLVSRYLRLLWFYPNYDIWEENGSGVHLSTLASVYGGLAEMGNLLGDEEMLRTAREIRTYVLTNGIADGTFVKDIGSTEVDASLLWLAVPFGLVEKDDPVFVRTVERIEKELLHGGGLHRYAKDTYYGGGEWVLLSCWLGWYDAQTGRREEAERILRWAESSADEAGNLPEQVCDCLNDGRYYDFWVEKWGRPANPLLWSHAMYLILASELRDEKTAVR